MRSLIKDPAGPIKSVVVKSGKVAKAIGKGSGLGHTLAAIPIRSPSSSRWVRSATA